MIIRLTGVSVLIFFRHEDDFSVRLYFGCILYIILCTVNRIRTYINNIYYIKLEGIICLLQFKYTDQFS